jgi:hypothetical protein
MRNFVLFVVTVVTLPGLCQNGSSIPRPTDDHRYTGKWWATASPNEQSGFINGVSDCLTWTAHKHGFNGTPEQLMPKITTYYEQHPSSRNLSVLEVWQKISRPYVSSASQDSAAEVWKNPHWYLNARWWGSNDNSTNRGFVEGYLWCMRTQIDKPPQSYSYSAPYYVNQINAFIEHNPKSGPKSIADILALFADKQTILSK